MSNVSREYHFEHRLFSRFLIIDLADLFFLICHISRPSSTWGQDGLIFVDALHDAEKVSVSWYQPRPNIFANGKGEPSSSSALFSFLGCNRFHCRQERKSCGEAPSWNSKHRNILRGVSTRWSQDAKHGRRKRCELKNSVNHLNVHCALGICLKACLLQCFCILFCKWHWHGMLNIKLAVKSRRGSEVCMLVSSRPCSLEVLGFAPMRMCRIALVSTHLQHLHRYAKMKKASFSQLKSVLQPVPAWKPF